VKFRVTSLAILLIGALFVGQAAFSQESEDTTMYSRTFFILKITPHNLGYRVVYQTESGGAKATYIPLEWFKGSVNKAQMLYLYDRSGSYMQVFWKDGEFSHVRITVPPNLNAPVWGVLPATVDASSAVAVDTLNLQY